MTMEMIPIRHRSYIVAPVMEIDGLLHSKGLCFCHSALYVRTLPQQMLD